MQDGVLFLTVCLFKDNIHYFWQIIVDSIHFSIESVGEEVKNMSETARPGYNWTSGFVPLCCKTSGIGKVTAWCYAILSFFSLTVSISPAFVRAIFVVTGPTSS